MTRELGIVSVRVGLVLRSAEIKPLFQRFVPFALNADVFDVETLSFPTSETLQGGNTHVVLLIVCRAPKGIIRWSGGLPSFSSRSSLHGGNASMFVLRSLRRHYARFRAHDGHTHAYKNNTHYIFLTYVLLSLLHFYRRRSWGSRGSGFGAYYIIINSISTQFDDRLPWNYRNYRDFTGTY